MATETRVYDRNTTVMVKDGITIIVALRGKEVLIINESEKHIPYVFWTIDSHIAYQKYLHLIGKMVLKDSDSKYFGNPIPDEHCINGDPCGKAVCYWEAKAEDILSQVMEYRRGDYLQEEYSKFTTMPRVEQLKKMVAMLDAIYANDEYKAVDDNGENNWSKSSYNDLEELQNILWPGIVDTNTCSPDEIAIVYLMAHGYDTWAGESDSYGWVTGCIGKRYDNDDRVIVFG